MPALQGIGGAGIPHFSHRMILDASDLAGQALPNAAQTTLKWQSLNNTGDLARFASGYSAATGIFAAPLGGLKNVQILCQLVLAGLTNAEMYIEINNVVRGWVNWNKFGQASLCIPALVQGDQIKVVLFNTSSGPQTAAAGVLDFLQIFASN